MIALLYTYILHWFDRNTYSNVSWTSRLIVNIHIVFFWYHPEALKGKVWLDHLEIVGHAAAICEHAPPIPQHVETGPEVEFSLALS